MRVSLWILRLGIALAAVGLALLSPLDELLPVGFWPFLEGLFTSGSMPPEPVYYRLVPGKESRSLEFLLIGVGAALVAASLHMRDRRRR